MKNFYPLVLLAILLSSSFSFALEKPSPQYFQHKETIKRIKKKIRRKKQAREARRRLEKKRREEFIKAKKVAAL